MLVCRQPLSPRALGKLGIGARVFEIEIATLMRLLTYGVLAFTTNWEQ